MVLLKMSHGILRRTVKSATKGLRAASSSLLDLHTSPMPSRQMMLLALPESSVRGLLMEGNSGSTSGVVHFR